MAPRVSGESSSLSDSVIEGIFKGDFSEDQSASKSAAQIGVGFIPIVGQIADARDTAAAVRGVYRGEGGAWRGLGLSLIGWVPVAGDFIKSSAKIGVGSTFKAIRSSFRAASKTWSKISRSSEKRQGKFSGLFYQPKIVSKARGLDDGVHGVTNRWGDIKINKDISAEEAAGALDHEKVHQFLSPKFKYGQEFRAKLGIFGYAESHLFRRVEEGLAEAWAGWKRDGLKGLKEGWQFPYKHPYGLDSDRINLERNILVGIGSTSVGAGVSLGDAISSEQ